VAITDDRYELDGDTAVRFSVACDGVAVDVIHRGNVAESFQMGVPVVLEGRWSPTDSLSDLPPPWRSGANDGWFFDSDRMLVKHDNEYRTDRIEEAASCGDDVADAPSG
jgi:cytochrome c-type biogenesis protein CcmE